MRDLLKLTAHGMAWLLVTPSVASFRIRAAALGRDRAIEGSTQAWASSTPRSIASRRRRAASARR